MCNRVKSTQELPVSLSAFLTMEFFKGGRAGWCSWRGTKQGGYQRAARENKAAWNVSGTLGSKSALKAIFT